MELRDLCILRKDLAQQKGQEFHRIRLHMRRNVEFEDLSTQKALNTLQERFADDFTTIERVKTHIYLKSKCDNIEKTVENYVKDNSDIRNLVSIPCIGILTATELISMIVTIYRFETADKMRSFFGMTPNVRDSGNTVKHVHIIKQGDPMMRQILNRTKIRTLNGTVEISRDTMIHMSVRIKRWRRALQPVINCWTRYSQF